MFGNSAWKVTGTLSYVILLDMAFLWILIEVPNWKKNTKNHRSAIMFPDDVEAYIQEDIDFGAIVGPFSDPPFQELHIPPFLTREKPGGRIGGL